MARVVHGLIKRGTEHWPYLEVTLPAPLVALLALPRAPVKLPRTDQPELHFLRRRDCGAPPQPGPPVREGRLEPWLQRDPETSQICSTSRITRRSGGQGGVARLGNPIASLR